MNNKKSVKTLVIVAGAAGEIGTEFCRRITKKKIDCIAIVRNRKVVFESAFLTQITCDLTKEKEIEKVFAQVDFSKYQRVVFLHTIGVDKFEPRGYPNIKPMDTIPSDVYNTNVNTFKYLLKCCTRKIGEINLQRKSKIKFKIVIVAGSGDMYAPFVIESFCETKFILRQYIQSHIRMHPSWISGLSVNITSTITETALKIRPYADTKYWLTPKEVVTKSINLLTESFSRYKEVDIIKNSPNFVGGYYENNDLLYEKWSKETGIK